MPARSVRRLVATAIATLLVATACSDAVTPADPAAPPSPLLFSPPSQNPLPAQLAVAQAVPGFGGYFLDAEGAPTVYLIDPTRRGGAEQALAAFLSARGFAAADLRVAQGAFGYAQLDQWYRLARAAVFAVPGVVLGDVDEGKNRVRIGVTNATAAAGVLAAIARLGIPSTAVIIEQRAPIAAVATLRDRVRPLQGGLQINFFPTPAGTPGLSLICTLGFNAELNGVMSFITNSHCSNVEGGQELPTQYYQSLRSGGAANLIGTEVDDPQWQLLLTLECPPPFACRYSDAARVQYEPGAEVALGSLSSIDEITTSLADTTHTINGAFAIGFEQLDPVQGEVAHKVGRTTGWTTGTTTATCVDVIALGTTHIRLCQAMVAALVDGGDSGSPVFLFDGNAVVTLLGILWGGSTDEANPEFAYSPLSGVKRELGNFRTF